MKSIERSMVAFWLTHCFLRRIAKRYPKYFEQWIKDLTDDPKTRRIMYMRYLGDTPYKFEAIAIEMGMSPRRVFELHKRIIDQLVSN